MEPVPGASKTDPPLAKAKPIGYSSSTSVRTHLRRKKEACITFAAGERSENSAGIKVSEEGGEEVLQALEQRFPSCLWRRPW